MRKLPKILPYAVFCIGSAAFASEEAGRAAVSQGSKPAGWEQTAGFVVAAAASLLLVSHAARSAPPSGKRRVQ